MKRFVIIGLALFLVAGMVFAQAQRFRNGNFNANGRSYNAATSTANGQLTARVTFRGNRITQIEITAHTDSPAFVTMVTTTMVPAIIQAQNPNVDTVSGATYTSLGLREAVTAAMAQARR
ncbi:MAG: FMN-binding protein [Treponema sp.]|nr:FMN-binding protein [Treponema sp.]